LQASIRTIVLYIPMAISCGSAFGKD